MILKKIRIAFILFLFTFSVFGQNEKMATDRFIQEIDSLILTFSNDIKINRIKNHGTSTRAKITTTYKGRLLVFSQKIKFKRGQKIEKSRAKIKYGRGFVKPLLDIVLINDKYIYIERIEYPYKERLINGTIYRKLDYSSKSKRLDIWVFKRK